MTGSCNDAEKPSGARQYDSGIDPGAVWDFRAGDVWAYLPED